MAPGRRLGIYALALAAALGAGAAVGAAAGPIDTARSHPSDEHDPSTTSFAPPSGAWHDGHLGH